MYRLIIRNRLDALRLERIVYKRLGIEFNFLLENVIFFFFFGDYDTRTLSLKIVISSYRKLYLNYN